MISETITKISKTLHAPDLFKVSEGVTKPIKQSQWSCSPQEYASFTTTIIASTFFILTVILTTILEEVLLSLLTGIILSLLVLIGLKKLPSRTAKKRSEKLEAFLPIALRTIASELDSKASFEVALKSSLDCGEFGQTLKRVLKLSKKGFAYSKIFKHLSDETQSLLVKRAFTQLYLTYSHGGSPYTLRKLADEAMAKQKQAVKEHSAKTAFLGTIFLTISAIIPAFFGAYAVISSSFLDATFTPFDILLLFTIVFPLLDLMVLIYLKESSPKVLTIG